MGVSRWKEGRGTSDPARGGADRQRRPAALRPNRRPYLHHQQP